MARSLTAAGGILGVLQDAGIRATLDIREVLGLAPCVLIPPPAWDDWAGDGSPLYTWRLIAVSGLGMGNLDAWAELDELVTQVAEVLSISRCDPIAYTLPTGGSALPAYAITYQGS